MTAFKVVFRWVYIQVHFIYKQILIMQKINVCFAPGHDLLHHNMYNKPAELPSTTKAAVVVTDADARIRPITDRSL